MESIHTTLIVAARSMNDRNAKNTKQGVMKKYLSSTILRHGASLLTVCLLANGAALRAQEFSTSVAGAPPPGAKLTLRTGEGGGGFGLVINGADIGTIVLKACDRDGDG